MFAIIRTGGKQYRVEAGDTVRVEKLEAKLGDRLELPEVLMVGGEKAHFGEPTVPNAKVTAVVVRQGRDAKITVFKKKRRMGYRRTQGHRQWFTELFIDSITSPEGQTAKSDAKPVVVDPAKKEERLKKLAEAQKAAGTKAAKKPARKVKKQAAVKKAAPKKKTAKKKVAKKKTSAKKK